MMRQRAPYGSYGASRAEQRGYTPAPGERQDANPSQTRHPAATTLRQRRPGPQSLDRSRERSVPQAPAGAGCGTFTILRALT